MDDRFEELAAVVLRDRQDAGCLGGDADEARRVLITKALRAAYAQGADEAYADIARACAAHWTSAASWIQKRREEARHGQE
jgi:hypothetical protein